MPEEQIKRYVPKTTAEQGKNDELQKMKEDIAFLLKEVEELKAGQVSSNHKVSDSGRGESLLSVDSMHEAKRRKKEEQLLKEHPDFKPSKRLRDSLTDTER